MRNEKDINNVHLYPDKEVIIPSQSFFNKTPFSSNNSGSILFINIVKSFILSCAVILYFTGLGKIYSAIGHSRYLYIPDFIFNFLTNRQILLFAAILELIIASILIISRSIQNRLFLILWICIIFLLYRIGLWYGNYTGSCKCIGFILDWTGLKESTINKISLLLLVYMLSGSILFILYSTLNQNIIKNTSLLLLIFLCSIFNIKAQEYQVSGTLQVSVYNQTNYEWGNMYNFDASIIDCKYIITISMTNDKDTNKLNYFRYIYDGNNFYELFRYDVPKDDTNIFAGYSLIIKTSNNLPQASGGTYVEYIWLAYASHCYLNSITNNRLNPIWPLNDHTIKITEYWIDAVIKRYNDSLALPYKIVYVESGDIRYYNSRTGSSFTIKANPPYDKGYITAVYEVNNASTDTGYTIPTEFTFTKFSTPSEEKPQYVRVLIIGRVNSIKKGSIPVALPTGPDKYIYVTDWRYPNVIIESNETIVIPVNYAVKSNIWPDEKDIMIARLDKENKLLKATPRPKQPMEIKQKQNPFVYIIIIVILLPLIYVIYKQIKKI